MNIELVRLTPEYKTQLIDMLMEWKADIEKNHTNHSPFQTGKGIVWQYARIQGDGRKAKESN